MSSSDDFYRLLKDKTIRKVELEEDHLSKAWESPEFAKEFCKELEDICVVCVSSSGFTDLRLGLYLRRNVSTL